MLLLIIFLDCYVPNNNLGFFLYVSCTVKPQFLNVSYLEQIGSKPTYFTQKLSQLQDKLGFQPYNFLMWILYI